MNIMVEPNGNSNSRALSDRDINAGDTGGLSGRHPFRIFTELDPPRVDVYKTKRDIIIKAEIPGVSNGRVNAYAGDSSIRISGQTENNGSTDNHTSGDSALESDSFTRTIPLPVKIIADRTRAEYRDGILTITAPREENEQ